MENQPPSPSRNAGSSDEKWPTLSSTPPPNMPQAESLPSRVWKRFQERPLLPVGCGITAYFLFSGIHYFQKRDPINSHRMMRYRVMAQFMTLACFLAYIGADQADFRIAPKYQDLILRKGDDQTGSHRKDDQD